MDGVAINLLSIPKKIYAITFFNLKMIVPASFNYFIEFIIIITVATDLVAKMNFVIANLHFLFVFINLAREIISEVHLKISIFRVAIIVAITVIVTATITTKYFDKIHSIIEVMLLLMFSDLKDLELENYNYLWNYMNNISMKIILFI